MRKNQDEILRQQSLENGWLIPRSHLSISFDKVIDALHKNNLTFFTDDTFFANDVVIFGPRSESKDATIVLALAGNETSRKLALQFGWL